MPKSIATIFLVLNQQHVPLLFPHEAHWTLKNDKTERPGVGKTESYIEQDVEFVRMKGQLASLPSTMGRVGFSLMETNITQTLIGSEGILFTGTGTSEAIFSVLVKDNQSDQPQGTLTFQWDFQTDGEKKTFFAPWKDFTATIRGKKVSGFQLDLNSVHSLSFQISRSHQKQGYDTVPLEFEWEM